MLKLISLPEWNVPNSFQGFVTMILRCSEEINNMSYAWRRLREVLGDDIDRKVNRMCFLKGKMVSFCFVSLILGSSDCSLFLAILRGAIWSFSLFQALLMMGLNLFF